MGFFKDLKQDLSQAVNELTEDAAKITSDESESVQETVPDDDVMVDTLNEEPEDSAEDIDVSKMLENVDTNEEAVTEEPKAEESETAGPFKEPEKKKTKFCSSRDAGRFLGLQCVQYFSQNLSRVDI